MTAFSRSRVRHSTAEPLRLLIVLNLTGHFDVLRKGWPPTDLIKLEKIKQYYIILVTTTSAQHPEWLIPDTLTVQCCTLKGLHRSGTNLNIWTCYLVAHQTTFCLQITMVSSLQTLCISDCVRLKCLPRDSRLTLLLRNNLKFDLFFGG